MSNKKIVDLRSFWTNWKRGPIKIAGIYLLAGVLWILFSDIIAAAIAPDQATLTKINIYKGGGFIVVTAGLLYWLIRRYASRLQKNDELLQLTGEMAKVGGWEFDAATLQGTWTDEVARIHDLDPSQPTNVELGVSFYLPESRNRIEAAVQEAVEFGKPYDLELEMLSAKGAHKWVRTIARPVLENGRVTRVRGIFQDITERKTIEASLKENEERFRTLYENATIGLYRTTPEGQILLCNPALLDMLGYESFEELAQRNLEAEGYEPGYERGEFRQKIESQGEVRGFESAWSKRDGSSVYIRESAKAIRNADGNVIYYEGTVEDITERKKYEEALQLENERFMRIFNSNIVGMVIADTVGNLSMANDYYLNILGVTRQDFLDGEVQWTQFTPPEWLPADENAIRELRERGVCEPYEKEYERADGTRVSVYIADAMLPGPGEQVAAIVIDITERKLMEEELKRSNTELEQFAYVASHDLQEPLRAIAGMVQLLQKHYQGKLDERADEYIDHTVEAAGRMHKLINDLLTYSRVNRFGNQFEMTDVEKALNTALANLRVALQESHATVTHDPLPSLMIDETQIGQVFQNLIGNAIKFRGERTLKVHIGTQEGKDAWRFEVRDNGIGIEPQYFERIFGVFQRLHTRREYPGTGIGLSLCKKIVERHGGRIWVESEFGGGTSFYFTLPNRK
jgi:PAS domain S-box-containing protein